MIEDTELQGAFSEFKKIRPLSDCYENTRNFLMFMIWKELKRMNDNQPYYPKNCIIK